MPIRWGILGCGDIARKRVAEAVLQHTDSELVITCRRDTDKLAQFCHDFSVPHSTTDAKRLLESDQIDAVYIATPPNLHCQQTIDAAKFGKHVLVEKPMAISTDECQKMVDACADANVTLGVAYYRRFYPNVEKIKQLLAKNTIGNLLSVSLETSTPFAIKQGEDGYFRAKWSEGGGGALMDIGSHRIDLLLDLFGDIDQVHALCDTVCSDYETEDCATVIMRFNSGIHGRLHCLFGTTANVDRLNIVGTQGQIIADSLNGDQITLEIDGQQETILTPRDVNSHLPLIIDFVAAIEENRSPRISGIHALTVNQMMENIYRNAGVWNQ